MRNRLGDKTETKWAVWIEDLGEDEVRQLVHRLHASGYDVGTIPYVPGMERLELVPFLGYER